MVLRRSLQGGGLDSALVVGMKVFGKNHAVKEMLKKAEAESWKSTRECVPPREPWLSLRPVLDGRFYRFLAGWNFRATAQRYIKFHLHGDH